MEVLVVGAGASGMMAAISAAGMGAYVTICEKEDIAGRKILRTGNGKCNLGNRDLRTDYYHSSDNELLDAYFSKFDEEDTIRTFRSLGLIIKESGGLFYPFCEQASVVRDVLLSNIEAYGIKVLYDTYPEKIVKVKPDRFEVTFDGRTREYDRVILACGSYAGIDKKDRLPSDIDGYSLAYSLGHTVIPVKPALTALNCKGDFWKEISGVRAEALIKLTCDDGYIGSEYGEVQFTDTGISGIPVFQLSHYVGANPDRSYSAVLDLMPGLDEDEYISLMQNRMLAFQGHKVRDFVIGTINSKLGEYIASLAGLNLDDVIDDSTEDKIIEFVGLIKCFKADIKNTKDFTHSQCCSGGIPLRETDDNCQSVKTPGLYICGEMLDVDGACGGYNLQWAWTSGYIAGRAAGSY